MEKLKYCVDERVLSSLEYGNVPQARERIYIIAFKKKKHYEKFNWPGKKKPTKQVRDVLEKDIAEKYYYNNKPLYKKIKKDVKREDRVYQWRRVYVRENKSGVCPTLTANMGTGGHNVPIIKDSKGIRKLTPRECFNIQGFPKKRFQLPEIADSCLYKQAGNSVAVPVIEAIAREIKKIL